MVLRSIEDHLRTQGPANLTVGASAEASLYILNHKRSYLRDIEKRYGVTIVIQPDEKAHGAHFSLERGAEAVPPALIETKAVHMEAASLPSAEEEEDAGEGDDKRPTRRRRRRKRGRGDQSFEPALENGNAALSGEAANDEEEGDEEDAEIPPLEALPAEQPVIQANSSLQTSAEEEGEGPFRRNRRRGRRGGRRHREEGSAFDYARSPQPAHIPGLGEQPTINSDHDFPKNLTLGPISPRPALPEPAQAVHPEVAQSPTPAEDVIQAEPLPAQQTATPPENQPAAKAEESADQPQQVETAVTQDQAPPAEITVVSEPPALPLLSRSRSLSGPARRAKAGGNGGSANLPLRYTSFLCLIAGAA